MPTVPHSSEELIAQLRQQLILAQVRIMELEDARDELLPKFSETKMLLEAAQSLVETKVEEADHLTQVRHDLQNQYEHLQHIQHVTNKALESTRSDLCNKQQQVEALQREIEQLHALIGQLNEEVHTQQERSTDLEQNLAFSRETADAHAKRIEQLDSELRAMKASRSWRWMAWLRSIERRLR